MSAADDQIDGLIGEWAEPSASSDERSSNVGESITTNEAASVAETNASPVPVGMPSGGAAQLNRKSVNGNGEKTADGPVPQMPVVGTASNGCSANTTSTASRQQQLYQQQQDVQQHLLQQQRYHQRQHWAPQQRQQQQQHQQQHQQQRPQAPAQDPYADDSAEAAARMLVAVGGFSPRTPAPQLPGREGEGVAAAPTEPPVRFAWTRHPGGKCALWSCHKATDIEACPLNVLCREHSPLAHEYVRQKTIKEAPILEAKERRLQEKRVKSKAATNNSNKSSNNKTKKRKLGAVMPPPAAPQEARRRRMPL